MVETWSLERERERAHHVIWRSCIEIKTNRFSTQHVLLTHSLKTHGLSFAPTTHMALFSPSINTPSYPALLLTSTLSLSPLNCSTQQWLSGNQTSSHKQLWLSKFSRGAPAWEENKPVTQMNNAFLGMFQRAILQSMLERREAGSSSQSLI